MVSLPLLSLFSSACGTLLSSKCIEQECTKTELGQTGFVFVKLLECTQKYLQGSVSPYNSSGVF